MFTFSYHNVFVMPDFFNAEEFCLLGYNAMQSIESPLAFWRNMSPPSSRSKKKPSKKKSSSCYLLHAGLFLGLFFDLEDGGDIFVQNTGWLSTDYTALCPRR
jgi:hypothetical protein